MPRWRSARHCKLGRCDLRPSSTEAEERPACRPPQGFTAGHARPWAPGGGPPPAMSSGMFAGGRQSSAAVLARRRPRAARCTVRGGRGGMAWHARARAPAVLSRLTTTSMPVPCPDRRDLRPAGAGGAVFDEGAGARPRRDLCSCRGGPGGTWCDWDRAFPPELSWGRGLAAAHAARVPPRAADVS